MEMITFKEIGNYGRLGNQLFQISTVINIANENNIDFVFRNGSNGWSYNSFLKNAIPTDDNLIDSKKWIRYNEPFFHYTPINYNAGNLDIFGYFQSDKYFKNSKDIIKKYLTLKDEFIDYIMRKYPNVHNCCSIHVRRGDYLKIPNVLPTQDMNYYIKSLKELYGDDYDDMVYMIFSDDMEWCKNNFNLKNMTFVEGNEDIIDLFTMSMCKDNVISNSSFSWWAAWLNDNDNRVISPKKWFSNGGPEDYWDIYCENWIKI
jgi:hypothetical protein